MKLEDNPELREKAKQMLIDGESYDKIMDVTHLRLKDVKRIEREMVAQFKGIPVANISDSMGRIYCIDYTIKPFNNIIYPRPY